MMSDEDIFKKYALLRVTEDSSITFSDYPSKASASLNFLSKVSHVQLIAPNEDHWVRDDDPIQPELTKVENITPLELEKKREKNIENITQVFSPSLALRIKQFEIYTKDFYNPEKNGTEIATKLFEKALALLPENSDDQDVLSVKVALQRRIETNKEALKPYVDPFHEAIRAAYREKDLLKQADILKRLYYTVDKRDLSDIQRFIPEKKTVSVNRFRTELKRDIAKQIQICFQYYGGRGSDVMYWQQEIGAHNDVLKNYKTKLLGEKGAFGKGGIYGPDSKLLWPKKEYVAPKARIEGQEEQLKLFTDKDFEY